MRKQSRGRGILRIWRTGWLPLILAAPTAALAAMPTRQCPASIPEKSIQIQDTPGWKTFVGAPLYLHGAAPMSSAPELLGELAGYTEQRRNDAMVYTYHVGGQFPNGKWLACKYGESDQVTLARRLPDTTDVCVITSRKGEYVGQNDVRIECK